MNEQYKNVLKTLGKLASAGASDAELGVYLQSKGLTIEDIGTLAEGPTVFGQAKEAVKGIIPGAIGLLETAGAGAAAILPEDMERSVRRTIEETAASAREPFKAAPGYEETVGRKLGEAVGSTVPFLAAGPFGLAGRVAAVGLGTAAGAGEARTRAEAEGATAEERASATGFGIIPGALEAFAPLRILKRLDKDVIEGGVDYVRRALVAGGEEAAQEAASAYAQNLIAKGVYKPEQELIEGLGEQAAYGGATGAIIQGLLDMAIGRRARPTPAPTEAGAPVTPPETPVGVPAEAQQMGLFTEEEAPVQLTPDESAFAQRQESMVDEARRQQALVDADRLRNEFDTLQRENERLKAQYDRTEDEEARKAIRQEASRISPALASLEKELNKVESKLPKEERGRPTAPPEQMGLDFEAPEMFRQRTPEGQLLEPAPQIEGLSPEQQSFFQQQRLQSVRDRLAAGEMVTPAEMAATRQADIEAQRAFEAAPTPEIAPSDERIAKQEPFFGLQPSDVEQPTIPTREEPVVETRPVVEADFKAMGIGATNKKLREQLLGKDLGIPAERDAVKETLEDYANAPNRSEKLRNNVEQFLAQPMFMQQMELGLEPRREPDVGEPARVDRGRGEPSVSVPSEAGAAPTGTGAPVGKGVVQPSGVSGVSDEGKGVQQRPMRRAFVEAARRTYNRLREEGEPSWRDLGFDRQMQFMDAFEEVKPGVPRYRLATEGTQGMPVDKVRKLVDRMTAKWKNPPDIFVVKSTADLEEYGLTDVDPTAKGVFYAGDQSVFLIADNITDYTDAVITVAHESIGHFGLQSVLGDKYNSTMNRLYETNAEVRKLADAKMAKDGKLDKRIAVEEVIAEAVEKKVAPQSGLGRALATLRNILRNFFRMVGAQPSNSEIDSLIAQAANYVVAGTVQVEKNVTKTDAFKNWFGDSVIRNPDGTPKIMYHGTAQDIAIFRPQQAKAIFVTDDPQFADTFTLMSEEHLQTLAAKEGTRYTGGRNIMPLYVRAERPFDYENRTAVKQLMDEIKNVEDINALLESIDVDSLSDLEGFLRGGEWGVIENPEIQRLIKKAGFDSFYVMEDNRKNLAVYDPNQVKSATGNAGSFSRDEADIRLSKKGATTTTAPTESTVETPATDPMGFARVQAINSFDRRNSSDYSDPEEAIDFGLDNLNDTLTEYGVTDPYIREQAVEAYRNEIARLKGAAAPTKTLTDAGIRYRKKKPVLTAEGQKAQAVVDSMKGISNEKPKGPTPGLLSSISSFVMDPAFRQDKVDRLRTQVAYKGASVERKLQDAFNGKLRDALGNIRADVFMTSAEHSDTLAVAAMKRGTLKLDKNIGWVAEDGKASLFGVMEKIKQLGIRLGDQDLAFKLANDAFIARRANTLKNLPEKSVVSLPSQDKIDAGLKAFKDFPELDAAFNEFTEFKNGLVDAMVEGGRLSKEDAASWKNAVDYVPWNRIKEYEENVQTSPKSAMKGLTNLGRMKQIKGGQDEINNIFDNMVGLSFWMTNSAIRNHAALQLTDAFVKYELGAKRVNADLPGVNQNNVIYVYRDGNSEAYEFDSIADVYAFKGVESIGGPILGTLTSFSNFLRKATTATPQFALSQLFQDSYRATVMSGTRSPFRAASRVLTGFIDAYRGDPTTEQLERMGIVGMYDLMPGRAQEEIETEFGIRQKSLFNRGLSFMESFSIASDAALRKAVFEQTLKDTQSAQFPEGDALLARYRAQEVINFKRQGSNRAIGVLRQVIPFMNAYIQGMDVYYRSMIGRGVAAEERAVAAKLFWKTGVKLATLSLIYAALVGDDEEYEGLRDYEKDKNFIIPGLGVKVPVAPEVGLIFKVLPERAYNYIASQGTDTPQDATNFLKAMSTATFDAIAGPNLTPQFFKPALEVMVNYSFFTGNPIVGRGLENVASSQQFTDSTSELAKMIGGISNISPMKLDYLIRGYTGIAGGTLLDVTNMMVLNRPERHTYELPLFKTFMYDKIPGGYKEQYYDLRNRVDQVADTINSLKATGRVEELQEYLTDDRLRLLALRRTMNRIDQRFEDLRKYKKIISADPTMDGAEKRGLIDSIEQMEIQMLKAYNIPSLRKNIAGL